MTDPNKLGSDTDVPDTAAAARAPVQLTDEPDPLQFRNPDLFRLLYRNYGSADARSDGGTCHWPAGQKEGPFNLPAASVSGGGDPKDETEHFSQPDVMGDFEGK